MAVKTVHFRIGHDAGKLIMQIAQEHLIYNLDPEKAMKTITESLCGIPEDLALSVLSGDHVIEVDIEDQEFVVYKRDEDKHQDFPQIDLIGYYKREHKKIGDQAKDLYDLLGHIFKDTFDASGAYMSELSVDSIVDLCFNNYQAIIDEIGSKNDFLRLKEIIDYTDKFILETEKKYTTLEWILVNYREYLAQKAKEDDNNYILKERHNIVDLVQKRYNSITNRTPMSIIAEENAKEDSVKKHIEGQNNVDKLIKNKIAPNDIKDLYNASWIAPNGDHYGINGEISNMLHIQLADKLMNDGIVVVPDDETMQPDTWMRQDGWVTIHNGWVLYDGYYHGKEITPEQQKAIYLFGQHYAYKTGKMPIFGIKRVPMTGARFEILEQFQLKHLFGL